MNSPPEESRPVTPSRSERLLAALAGRMDAWWYLPALALLAGLDMFIWVVPTDLLVITTALVRPRRWPALIGSVALGSALGMLALAAGVASGSDAFRHFIDLIATRPIAWDEARLMAEAAGPWALLVVTANPFLPAQPAIVVAVLAGMGPLAVFLWGLFGRLLKFGVYAILAVAAPRWLARVMRRG